MVFALAGKSLALARETRTVYLWLGGCYWKLGWKGPCFCFVCLVNVPVDGIMCLLPMFPPRCVLLALLA